MGEINISAVSQTAENFNNKSCSYVEWAKEQVYSYYAMCEMIYVMAFDEENSEAIKQTLCKQLFGVKINEAWTVKGRAQIDYYRNYYRLTGQPTDDDYVRAMSRGIIPSRVDQIYAQYSNDPKMVAAKKAYEDSVKGLSDIPLSEYIDNLWEFIKKAAKEKWKEIKESFKSCGLLYTTITQLTDVVDLAAMVITTGAAGALIRLSTKIIYKIVRTAIHQVGKAARFSRKIISDEFSIAVHAYETGSLKTILSREFRREALEAKYGAPEEIHEGASKYRPQRGRDIPDKPAEEVLSQQQKLSGQKIGKLAEAKAVEDLKAKGFTDVYSIQNASNHGVDIVAWNPETQTLKVVEVKANGSRLSDRQKNGGEWFLDDILERQDNGKGHWNNQSPELKAAVKELRSWQEAAKEVEYEVMRYAVDGDGKASFMSTKPWDAPVSKTDLPFQKGQQSKDPPNSTKSQNKSP